jgi:BirA family biotin operon repressor/biotin-[acetyl-CoA-carboxylase] ligase
MNAYLGLGSNLGDRQAMLEAAVGLLAAAGLPPAAVSGVYETEPQGRHDQPWFLNCVVRAETELTPRQVLEVALGVEASLGRERVAHWGPRVIDVDVLLCGDLCVREPDLVVPHPRLRDRAFALLPLAELAPDLVVPGAGPVGELLRRVAAEGGQEVRPWGRLRGWSRPVVGGPAAGTRQALLRRLRAAAPGSVSGTELASELGMSRSAVWKHVQRLRAEGQAVSGTTGRGYRLDVATDPDPLSSADLVAPRAHVGRVLHLLGSVDSTNQVARAMGAAGTPSGTVVVAEEQTAGRGRAGRRFLSPPGGVYLSAVLRPAVPPPQAGRLTLLGALAVAEALEACGTPQAWIKWPNDVLLPGGKVAGILLELVAREDRIEYVVLGAGINVRSAPPGVGATSLWAAGARAGRAEVARAVLDRLDAAYTEFEAGRWPALLGAWRRRCRTLGAPVRVDLAGGSEMFGRALDVSLEGALLLETADGVATVYAGDVTHLRAEGGRAAAGEDG